MAGRPMAAYWDEIERLYRARLPRGYKRYFGPGATPEALAGLEQHTHLTLPEDFKAFYAVHDGQGCGPYGLIFGLELLSLQRIRQAWDTWRAVGDDINDDLAAYMKSDPDGYIRPLYSNPKWLPFTSDQSGNHIGFDFDPDRLGVVGQVIIFGRDENTKRVFARSFRDAVHLFVEQLSTIDWRIVTDDGWTINHEQLGRRHYHSCFEGALRAPTEAAE